MLNKQVYAEPFSQEEYEAELTKTMKLGSIPHVFMFYLAVSYAKFIKNQELISDLSYLDLCDYLAENAFTLSEWQKDFELYTCSLVALDNPEDYQKGKHYPSYIESIIEGLTSNFSIDYKLGVYEELESVN
jgi:hypothetical protein